MSKVSTELITLCDYALNSKDGKLSIMGIFDRIFVKQLPAKYPRFFIVVVLNGNSTSKHDLSLQLTSPTGKTILPKKEVSVGFGVNGKANLITDITNLTLPEIGEYKFALMELNSLVAKTSLFVNQLESNQVQLPN